MSVGLLAEFTTPEAVARAAERLRAARVGAVETHTPHPPEGRPRSAIPLVMLAAGVLGCAGAFLLQTYATTVGYPVDVGGRPKFGWPAFVPLAFEFGVLCAVLAGFFGFLIACRLPALYDPIDEVEAFRRATRDRYFIALRTTDGAAIGRARGVLATLDPLRVQELPG